MKKYFAEKSGATRFANGVVSKGGKARIVGRNAGAISVDYTPFNEKLQWGWTKVRRSSRARAHMRKAR